MMKKILYLIICLLLVGGVANAQKKDSTKNKKSEKVAKELNLNRDQKKQMDSIHTETRKQKETITNDKSLTEDQKQQKIKDLNKQEKSKMKTVLTPEQQEKAKQMRESRRKSKDSSSAQ